MSTDPQREHFRKEYMNAMIALVTETLRETPNDPEYLKAASRVINEVPHKTQVVLSAQLIAMMVGELANAQYRTPEETWSEIALRSALELPEDDEPR